MNPLIKMALAVGAMALAGWAAQGWLLRSSATVGAAVEPSSRAASVADLRGGGKAAGARVVGVELAVVAHQTVRDDTTAVGTLRARQSVVVRAEVPGRIASLGFQDGQAVARGALLVQLDDSLQRADLAQAQAQVGVAQANHARTQELVAAKFLSQQALDTQAAALQVAQAQRDQAQARLSRMAVHAPFAGGVGIRQVTVGDYVKDGADLVTLEDRAPRVVDFRLPERDGARVQRGQAVQVRLDAQPDQVWRGRVEAIEPVLDATARSVLVRAALDGGQAQVSSLRSGQFARVVLTLGAPTEALTVPEQAIVAQGSGHSVVTAVTPQPADGVPPDVKWVSRRQAVRLGLRRDGWVQVTDGLTEGDRVVVAGHQRLNKDGTPLRDVAAPKGAGGKAAPGQAGGASQPLASTKAKGG